MQLQVFKGWGGPVWSYADLGDEIGLLNTLIICGS